MFGECFGEVVSSFWRLARERISREIERDIRLKCSRSVVSHRSSWYGRCELKLQQIMCYNRRAEQFARVICFLALHAFGLEK